MTKFITYIDFLKISVKKFFALLFLTFAIGSVSGQTNVVITTSGTWTVPIGVTSVTVGCYGGGGGGGGAYPGACSSGSGGGGGAFSTQTLAVSPGQVYNITIGAGGIAGTLTGVNGGTGGTTTFTGTGGTCTANGGSGGTSSVSSDFGKTKAGVSGGNGGTGFLYAGGNSGTSYHGSWSGSSGGGGGAGNGGPGGNSPGGNSSAAGVGGIGTYPGGAGGVGYCCSGNNSAGRPGNAPGGGGSGAATASCSSDPGNKGGVGAIGQVLLTYTVNPVCTSCHEWLNQNCAVASGSYIDGGTVTPTSLLQNTSTVANTSNNGYVYWAFNASAGTTYYFDLCYSAGTSGTSWLRLHKFRNTTPNNNYCMDASSDSTLVLQNRDNGCIGSGVGLSKIIWTCTTSGIYYLESAVNAYPTFWGVSASQTATLSYKTLPSSSITCTGDFYDKGSDGTNGSATSYNNDENWIYTYYPLDTVADAINVQFTSFSTSPGDVLCVYNGNSINAPVIGCYSGPSITGAFSSSANDGSLTFQFTSDDTLISSGWHANVSCVASLHAPDYASANKISLYPNPAKDQLIISHQGVAIREIEIYNSVGERVYGTKPDLGNQNPETPIDISSLRSGIYLIQTINETGSWNGKFVKQ